MSRVNDVACAMLAGAGLYEVALWACGQPSASALRGVFLVLWATTARLALGAICPWLSRRRCERCLPCAD